MVYILLQARMKEDYILVYILVSIHLHAALGTEALKLEIFGPKVWMMINAKIRTFLFRHDLGVLFI